jgi:molybdate transport system permease protein
LLALLSFVLIVYLVTPITSFFLKYPLAPTIGAAFTGDAVLALKLSMITSVISMVIIVALGTPLAFALTYWKFPLRSVVTLLVDLPVVLPPSVAGLGLLMTFGRNGLFGDLLNQAGVHLPFTTAAVIMAQVFVSAPLFIRTARVGFASINHQFVEAARVEGASSWQLLTLVMLPLARNSLISGAMLSLTRALGEFGATILFAGNMPGITQTMPVAIYLGFERNIQTAIGLSVMLVSFSLGLLALTRLLEPTSHEEVHAV